MTLSISRYPYKRFKPLSLLLLSRFSTSFEINRTPLTNTNNKVYIINTSSRGIGYEFTSQLLSRSSESTQIIGLYGSKTDKLHELKQAYPNKLHLVHIDTESQPSIDNAIKEISSFTNKVDMLINSAGILGDGKSTPGPERALANIDRAWLEKTLQVNLIGHVMVTQGLVPLFKRPKAELGNLTKIVNISARVGSIEDNNLGGWYSYRMSKAALNMFTKTASIELKRHGCVVLSMHPGKPILMYTSYTITRVYVVFRYHCAILIPYYHIQTVSLTNIIITDLT